MNVSKLSGKYEIISASTIKRQACFFQLLCLAFFLSLPMQANADTRFKSGIAYYFDAFDPNQKPWNPGQDLNYEEVFKNYEYFEIVFFPSGKEFTINRYLRNSKTGSEQYLFNPDGSISRKPQSSPPAAAN